MVTSKDGGSSSRGHYEFVEHTADIAIKAYGDSLADAFATAASAMFDIITDGSEIEPREEIDFETVSVDLAGLLVGFLSDLIVLYETEDMLFTEFDVEFDGHTRIRVRARGESFDENKHSCGHQVKGVSYHMMEMSDGGGKRPSFVQILFDV